jgi:hypothetical protein
LLALFIVLIVVITPLLLQRFGAPELVAVFLGPAKPA